MKIEVGQKVYVINEWVLDSIEEVRIININKENNTVDLKWKYGVSTESLDLIFETKEEAENYVNNKHKEIENEYRNSINSIEDLVKFCFYNNFCAEEYSNYLARKVALEKAKEYGIELE